jgi:hypothetical protein
VSSHINQSIVVQLNFKKKIPSLSSQEEGLPLFIVSDPIEHIIAKVVVIVLVHFFDMISLNLHQLRDVPNADDRTISNGEFPNLVALIVISIDILAFNHFNFIEVNSGSFCIDINDSHYFKSSACLVSLAHKDLVAAVTNVQVVLIMCDTPAFSNF